MNSPEIHEPFRPETASTPPAPAPAHRFAAGTDPRRKSPFLAGLFSVVPGVGQVYVGYYRRGFAHIAVFGLLVSLVANEFGGEGVMPLLAFLMVFFYLYNLVDAVRRASLYNLALDGIESVEMPEDFRLEALRGPRGSIVGGLLAIFVGTALFLYTKFDVPLDWVEEWWPLGVVLFGIYLVVLAVRDRRSGKPASDAAAD